MRIILEPLSGTAKGNLERAKSEIASVLGFRGTVTGAKAEGTRIIVEFEPNPKWDLPMPEKVESLRQWILAKARRTVFKVLDVAPGDNKRRKG